MPKTKKPMEMKDVNKLLNTAVGNTPVLEFKEPTNEVLEEQNYALAQMYAMKGYRSYLENAINLNIQYGATRSETLTDMVFFKSRVETLKSLLNVSKKAFERLEGLRRKSIQSKIDATQKG